MKASPNADGLIYVVSYGGGTNSTAILIGMIERGIIPALILFADTGNEKPETYEHLHVMSDWCKLVFGIPITVVKNSLPQGLIDGSLYGECLRLGTMPSKLFGYSTCSMKWKVEPQMKYISKWMMDNGIAHIQHVIGYDMDELPRMEKAERTISDKKAEAPNWRSYETNRYLLIEWNWGRDECIAAIARHQLKQPGKSACFMCPSSKKPEVLALKSNHPELYRKAIVMEARALAGEGQAPAARMYGLGRHWNWQTFAGSDIATPDTDCGCYDGD
jgi:3'-phosphoadenosine 5'-phosphosulfate sulfotransferase (PAPS reductase)/FAD synthetase